MRIITNEVWDVETSGEKVMVLSKGGKGDVVTSDLYIRLLDDASLTVTGFVGEDDEEGVKLAAIDMGGLSKVDDVTSAGNYDFSVSSYEKVKLEVEGSAKLILKTLY